MPRNVVETKGGQRVNACQRFVAEMSGLSTALLALSARLARVPPAAAPDLACALAMPLNQFAREGQLIEVQVPWHAETLWFVPDERDAAALGRDGVGRGRVWTAEELLHLMSITSLVDGAVRTISIVKATMDGQVVEVRASDPGPAREPHCGSEQIEGKTAYSARQGRTP